MIIFVGSMVCLGIVFMLLSTVLQTRFNFMTLGWFCLAAAYIVPIPVLIALAILHKQWFIVGEPEDGVWIEWHGDRD